MYITRNAEPTLREMAAQFKVLAVTGPRQSGKTTIVRHVFPEKPYASLENPDTREFALRDPSRFLLGYADGAILDEVQRCPELLSYLQGMVDQSEERGRFVLTGSQHFGLMAKVSQSLAGRVGIVHLLPLSLDELTAGGLRPDGLDAVLFKGGYPPVHDTDASPERWFNAYIETYLERDMRQLIHVHDTDRFHRFLKLCADSVGQLVDMTRIGSDCGVDQKTVKAWLAILETGFIIYRLRPHHENFRKRLVKTPKLYFHDTGLVARLLGIESVAQLATDRRRGDLFENWVVSEMLKGRFNLAKNDNLFFWRDNTGVEVDIIADRAGTLLPIEVKSGMTIASDWFDGLAKWRRLAGERGAKPVLIYGGDQRQSRETAEVLPWSDIGKLTA